MILGLLSAGSTLVWLIGIFLVSCGCNQLYRPLMLPSELMCQVHGAAVLTSMKNGFSCSGHLTGSPPLSWPRKCSILC